jgi:hypothetical protein
LLASGESERRIAVGAIQRFVNVHRLDSGVRGVKTRTMYLLERTLGAPDHGTRLVQSAGTKDASSSSGSHTITHLGPK